MSRNHQKASPPRRRRLAIGPGTIGAAAVAIAIVAFGGLGRGGAESSKPLSEVRASLAAARPVAPLRKPEVGELLRGPRAAGLSAKQRREIGRLASAWSDEKSALLEAMRRDAAPFGAGAPPLHTTGGVSMRDLQSGLASYSDLSRRYDITRAYYWARGLDVLTPAQRAQMAAAPARGLGGEEQ